MLTKYKIQIVERYTNKKLCLVPILGVAAVNTFLGFLLGTVLAYESKSIFFSSLIKWKYFLKLG